MIKSYKELIAYQKAYKLVQVLYQLTKHYPKSELYGMVSQIRRAAVSIPSNIAEGFMRGSKEYIQFLKIALGSSAEIETLVSLSKDLNYCSLEKYSEIIELNTEVTKLLIHYIKKLRN